MASASDLLNGKVLIDDDQEANILMLDRTLCGAIDVNGERRKPRQYAQAG